MEYDLAELRIDLTRDLHEEGFRFSPGLPCVKIVSLRPLMDLARRLMATKILGGWVCYSEQQVQSPVLLEYMDRYSLWECLGKGEREMLAKTRADANESHMNDVGWSFEGIWPLAWILGFGEGPPDHTGQMMPDDIVGDIFKDFAPGLGTPLEEWLSSCTPVDEVSVVVMEDLFYCVHNATRSAALGEERCVPPGFHPYIGIRVIQERRKGFTWALSPGVAWDDTDLST